MILRYIDNLQQDQPQEGASDRRSWVVHIPAGCILLRPLSRAYSCPSAIT
jgi:hypothetical protein